MRLTIVGCAGSFPSADSACSSYLVEAEGFRLVVDLGNGALGPLQRHIGLYDVDAVLVSHLHPDHWFDLYSYVIARTHLPDGPLPLLPVYGPAGTADRLALAHGAPPAVYDYRTLCPGTLEIGPFRLTVDHMNHPVETFGARIEHAGRSLAYSADTGPTEALVALARDADALLCEASFHDGAANPPNLHLTGGEAGGHASRAGVGRLLLTHLVVWNDEKRSYAEASGAYDGAVRVVRAGDSYDL